MWERQSKQARSLGWLGVFVREGENASMKQNQETEREKAEAEKKEKGKKRKGGVEGASEREDAKQRVMCFTQNKIKIIGLKRKSGKP